LKTNHLATLPYNVSLKILSDVTDIPRQQSAYHWPGPETISLPNVRPYFLLKNGRVGIPKFT
jgi:hypothetical protein